MSKTKKSEKGEKGEKGASRPVVILEPISGAIGITEGTLRGDERAMFVDTILALGLGLFDFSRELADVDRECVVKLEEIVMRANHVACAPRLGISDMARLIGERLREAGASEELADELNLAAALTGEL